MKNSVVLLFLIAFLIAPLALFAQNGELDVSDPASVIAQLTTFITLAAVWVVKKIAPKIPGTWTLLVAAALSGGVTWLTNMLGNPDLSWLAQFGLGLASTFLHQVYVKFTAPSA